MSFVRNIWYVAAWSDELLPYRLFNRKLLNEQILFYRKSDETPVAMSNLCPHRFAALHQGKLLEGDRVECPYHGLVFDCSGSCVDNPHGDGLIPKKAKLKTYPVVERDSLLWIWMGDPELADPDLIPDYSFMSDTKNWTTVHGTIKLNADYELIIDNLTDLSHAAFVHEGLLENREMAKGKFKVYQNGTQVRTDHKCPGIQPPYFFELFRGLKGLKDENGLVDHWVDMRYDPPGCMITYYGVTRRGGTQEEGLSTINPNLITPETETTTHYFWADSRNFDLNNSAVNELIRKALKEGFETQDKPILEMQHQMIGDKVDMMSLKPILLVNDGASTRARKIMQELRDKESAIDSRKASAA